jgi:hypothetical protein
MTVDPTGVVRKVSLADIGANTITVGNGLTKVGNLITFGGPLTSPTVINTSATNTLTLTHLQTGTLNLPTDSILTTGLNGVVRRVSVNDLAAASPDFWLDGSNAKPNGVTDNTDNVYHEGNVGIGLTAVPNSKFQVAGSVAMSILPVTSAASPVTLDETHHTLIADCTTATIAVTLPDPTGCTGRMYYISKSDETTNPLTFSRPLRLTDGATPVTVSSYNYTKRLIIQSDGANWRVISE